MDKEQAFARFRQSIEFLKDNGRVRSHEEVASLTGIQRPHVSAAMNGNMERFTKGFLRRFASAYSDYINEAWLLTGEGEMSKPDKSMRPHVGVKAAAGFMSGIGESDFGRDFREHIPFIPDYDFTIEADGESMLPRIESGDILACRFADDRMNPPIGRICVIDSKDGAAVKVLRSAENGVVVLHSLNAAYPDYSVAVSDINRIAVVVGVLCNLQSGLF